MDLIKLDKGMANAHEPINQNFESLKPEYESNENGEYWKYPDGRLVCTGDIEYDRSNPEVSTGFPHNFISAPAGSISSRSRVFANLQDLASLGYYFGTDEIRLMKHTQLGFREDTGIIPIKWVAFGRWK